MPPEAPRQQPLIHDHLDRVSALRIMGVAFTWKTNHPAGQMYQHQEGAVYRVEVLTGEGDARTNKRVTVYMIDPQTGKTLCGMRYHSRMDYFVVGSGITELPLPSFPEYAPSAESVAKGTRDQAGKV